MKSMRFPFADNSTFDVLAAAVAADSIVNAVLECCCWRETKCALSMTFLLFLFLFVSFLCFVSHWICAAAQLNPNSCRSLSFNSIGIFGPVESNEQMTTKEILLVLFMWHFFINFCSIYNFLNGNTTSWSGWRSFLFLLDIPLCIFEFYFFWLAIVYYGDRQIYDSEMMLNAHKIISKFVPLAFHSLASSCLITADTVMDAWKEETKIDSTEHCQRRHKVNSKWTRW